MDTLDTMQWPISKLIQHFQCGEIAVPEIQRDVVWDSEQVKGLIDSVSRAYPCGSLILWEPRERDAHLVRDMIRPERRELFGLPRYFLLDGQQRLTALACAMLPTEALRKLLPELEEEMPHLFGNLRRLPHEIEATNDGAGYKFPWAPLCGLFDGSFRDGEDFAKLLPQQRLAIENFVQTVKEYQFPVQIIRGRDYPTVGEIFSRVNSQGTPLTGAEIHLAKIVPHWPGITKEFRKYREDLRKKDYELDLTFLMRAITVIECRTPNIRKLAERVSKGEVKKRHLDRTWRTVRRATDRVIRVLSEDLYLDKTKFFTSKNVLVPLVYYASTDHNKTLARKDMLQFFLLSQLSGHYSAASETTLRADLRHLTDDSLTPRQGLRSLAKWVNQEARQEYRGLNVKPSHVCGAPSKNVILLILYILLRERGATDFGSGRPPLIGSLHSSEIQLHHIFPFNFMMTIPAAERWRKQNDYTRPEFRQIVNDVANLTCISQPKNSAIGDAPPWEYLPNETTAATRRAHFIPEVPELWRPENFQEFLEERRKLISKAVNALVKSLS